MLRASVLSIVLTLAVGPNATLLCRTWCDQQAAASVGCPHEDQTTALSLGGDDSCDTIVLSAAPLREGERRSVPSPNADHAIPGLRYELAGLVTNVRLGHQRGREWALDKRPLPTSLRI